MARVQAVVCTVISVQLFKQPDVHVDTGARHLWQKPKRIGRRDNIHLDTWLCNCLCLLGRRAITHIVDIYTHILFTYTITFYSTDFTAVCLPGSGSASLV